MTNESDRLAHCVDAALKVIQVMESIINAYLSADEDLTLFEKQELSQTWTLLKLFVEKNDTQGLDNYLKNALVQYINPLPTRPFVSMLLSKRFKMLACFHRHLELGDDFIKTSDLLFIDAIAVAFKKTISSNDDLNQEFIQKFKNFFTIALRQRLDCEYSSILESLASTPVPAYEPPLSATKFEETPLISWKNGIEIIDGYDSDGNEIREIIVPSARQITATSSLFGQHEFERRTTWDSDLNEEVIETVVP